MYGSGVTIGDLRQRAVVGEQPEPLGSDAGALDHAPDPGVGRVESPEVAPTVADPGGRVGRRVGHGVDGDRAVRLHQNGPSSSRSSSSSSTAGAPARVIDGSSSYRLTGS